MNTLKNKYNPVLRSVLLSLSFLWIAHTLSAQSNTLYWMQGIPQSTFINPAIEPLHTTFVGFPLASSIQLGMANSGFSLGDFIRKDQDGSLYYDALNMIDRMSNKNVLTFDFNFDYLSLGFRYRNNAYFTFYIRERLHSRLGYSRDFARLVIEGNDVFMQTQTAAVLDGLGLNLMHFREYGFGYSRNLLPDLNVGARFKVLSGLGNVQSRLVDNSLFTSDNFYEIRFISDIRVRTSMPLLNLLDDDDHSEDFHLANYMLSMKNMGMAIDVGGVYTFDDQYEFAFNINDLGFIRWNSNNRNYSGKGEFEFTGISFDEFFSEDNNLLENLTDTINDLLDLQESEDVYTTMLSPRIFASAAYNLTTMHRFSLLSRSEIYHAKLYPSFTLAYNFQPIRSFGSTLSYSLIHGRFSSLGLGMHINIWPMQIYVVTDSFLWTMRPQTAQSVNVQLGVNIDLGARIQESPLPRHRWNQ